MPSAANAIRSQLADITARATGVNRAFGAWSGAVAQGCLFDRGDATTRLCSGCQLAYRLPTEPVSASTIRLIAELLLLGQVDHSIGQKIVPATGCKVQQAV
ncbi:MAG: hypothetical protein H7Y19_00420 [Luteimonas sp.]|nr:hypothetical protein [Luteimonas sp.]